jgi:pyruvate,water dikinase
MRRLENFYKKHGITEGDDLLGGKASGLFRLQEAGFKIPTTWVVPGTSRIPVSSDRTLRELRHLIWNRYALHSESTPNIYKYAVRSCGADEDGLEMSFAGQHLTLLNVDSRDIREAIKSCRASGKLGKRYAEAMTGKKKRTPLLSVLVQPMVRADTAGVMFTGNPATGDSKECVIEEVVGLGDKLVDGTVNPDQRFTFRDAQTSGPEIVPNYINYLRSYSEAFSKILGRPADVEWAQYNGLLYFLQLRPLTGVDWEPVQMKGSAITGSTVTGVVQRLPSKTPFKAGNILVTTMTTPHMIDEMMQCSGIVTEIGGSTCHAAIVARELGKPCIVGCNEAEELFDGMSVTLNPTTGEVTNYGVSNG